MESKYIRKIETESENEGQKKSNQRKMERKSSKS